MPRRTNLTIDELPYQYKGKKLQLHKSYTNPRFESNTVLTDDIYTYIDFYFASHKKSLFVLLEAVYEFLLRSKKASNRSNAIVVLLFDAECCKSVFGF